ncbi:MAG: metal ABC transporter substrate-binding protein [Bacillota bacterium]
MKGSFIRKLIVLFTIVFFVSAVGCSENVSVENKSKNDERISVYTSFYTMYDFASKIGGDRVELHNLVPTGTEPHDWEPSPKDILSIEKADVLVYNGAGMEDWIEKILSSIRNEKLEVVEVSKDITLLKDDQEEHEEESSSEEGQENEDEHLENDPHIWLNPLLAKKQMEAIKNAFVKADPSNKDYYEKNYVDNAKKLDDLDSEYKEALSKYTKRDIIVAHKAFGYLCEAYGLRQVAIEGLNAESEPTPARMAEIVKFARDNNVKVIFFEELISPKVANAIAREVGARTEVLNPLEGLKEEDISAGKDYFSVMRENLEALKKALE